MVKEKLTFSMMDEFNNGDMSTVLSHSSRDRQKTMHAGGRKKRDLGKVVFIPLRGTYKNEDASYSHRRRQGSHDSTSNIQTIDFFHRPSPDSLSISLFFLLTVVGNLSEYVLGLQHKKGGRGFNGLDGRLGTSDMSSNAHTRNVHDKVPFFVLFYSS